MARAPKVALGILLALLAVGNVGRVIWLVLIYEPQISGGWYTTLAAHATFALVFGIFAGRVLDSAWKQGRDRTQRD